MELAPGVVIDRYTVESNLGEGGMAVVYKVRHNTLHSLHALKVLTITSPAIKQRLLQEGRVQGQLRHPNIVQVTDVVQVGDSPGLVLEFVQGPTLDTYIENESPTVAQADALAQGILDGVAAAHAKGLIHRDLKPGNILLQVGPTGLVPKIADFGLAKLLDGEQGGWTRTRTGSAMGTPHYMALEQIKDAATVGPQADVFALGAILYELVTGHRAFDGTDMLTVFNNIAQNKYAPPRQLVPDLPERMERAIVGALQADVSRRIQSVTELHAVWNGENLGPWDPKSIERVVAIVPEGATKNTRFSFVEPLTRFSAGAMVGGSALFAVVGVGLVALGLLGVIGVGWYRQSHVTAAVTTPATTEDAAPVPAPVPVQAPAPPEPAPAAEPAPALAPAPEVDIETIAWVGPIPPESGVTRPPVKKAAGGSTDASNPWGSPTPTKGGTAVAATTGGRTLPAGLDAESASERSAALDRLASDPGATWAIGEVMKKDSDASVRKRALKILVDRWDKGIGSASEAGGLVTWAAKTGTSDLRLVAVDALSTRGSSVSDLGSPLAFPQPTVRQKAAAAIVAVGKRTNQQSAGRDLLQKQLGKEDDAKTKKKLEDALGDLK